MSIAKQETRRPAGPSEDSPWPQVRLAETDRLETFSDSVLSITMTLLVFEIVRPEYAQGYLLEKLATQWAGYIAFLASFWYAGVIWLNHRAVFARVRYCDRNLHLANLFLLPIAGLVIGFVSLHLAGTASFHIITRDRETGAHRPHHHRGRHHRFLEFMQLIDHRASF